MVILKRSMVVDDIRWVAKVKTLRETASWRGSESALNLKRKRLGTRKGLNLGHSTNCSKDDVQKKRDRTAAQSKEHKRVAAIFE